MEIWCCDLIFAKITDRHRGRGKTVPVIVRNGLKLDDPETVRYPHQTD